MRRSRQSRGSKRRSSSCDQRLQRALRRAHENLAVANAELFQLSLAQQPIEAPPLLWPSLTVAPRPAVGDARFGDLRQGFILPGGPVAAVGDARLGDLRLALEERKAISGEMKSTLSHQQTLINQLSALASSAAERKQLEQSLDRAMAENKLAADGLLAAKNGRMANDQKRLANAEGFLRRVIKGDPAKVDQILAGTLTPEQDADLDTYIQQAGEVLGGAANGRVAGRAAQRFHVRLK